MNTHTPPRRMLARNPVKHQTVSVLCLMLTAWSTQPAHAASGTINGNAGDGQANSNGAVSATTATYGRIGADSGVRHSVVHVFEIPSSIVTDPTQQFSSATYGVKLGMGSAMSLNVDLYGLGYDTTPSLLASDFYEGAFDAGNSLIQDNFILPTTPAYATLSNSSAALVNYLNGVLTSARANNDATAYAFLRNSLDGYTWSGVYVLGMNEAGGTAVPTLAYNTVSVSSWSNVPLGGGGFVTGLVGDSTGADLYARTDVGGLFKWNAATGKWANLTDKIVPTTTRYTTSHALLGTMSVAIDPSNVNNLYVAVGGGALVSGASAGIYASSDKGATWSEITTGTPNFKINGNGGARSVGERLAVDPNNPNIIWYASELGGLIKGVKSGTTWTWSQVASTSVPYGANDVGVSFVACDKNGTTTLTYAGVHDSAGTTGGVYVLNGTSWSKVTGVAIKTPARAAVASDGTVYVAGNGVVAKLPRGGALASITPVTGRNYRGLAINPAGTVVYVSEVQPGTCEIWRSASGGTAGTWKSQGTASFNNWNNSASRIYPQEPDGSPAIGYQWFGNVAALWVNPTDVNELWASDFYGVQRTQTGDRMGNTAVNTQPVWYRVIKNLEETLAFAMKNAPSGNRLITGLADVGGHRYTTDHLQLPLNGNGGSLNATSGKNVTSLDFCEGSPGVWAYAWALNDYAGTGAVSLDGGDTWMRFGQIARRPVANSATAGWETWDLGNYLTKQRAKGVTTVTLIVAGGATWWEDTPSMSFHSKEAANQPQLVLNGGAVVLNPTADTYVYKKAATTNYGGSTSLSVRNNGGFDTVTYLKFNLSGVSTIGSAQLKLYRNASANTQTLDLGVHACANTTWTEGDGGADNVPAGEMTWNVRPYPMSDAGGYPLSSTPNYQQAGISLRGGRIAISSADPTVMVWAPIGSTVRYSEDRGVTWTAATGAPAAAITGVYTNGNSLGSSGQNLVADRANSHFYLATFGGTAHSIYRSTDGGKTWSPFNTVSNGGTYNMRTPQLVAAPPSAAYPSGGDLWLCDDSSYNENPYPAGGLWRMINGGAGWSKFTNIGRVSHVAFGKHPGGTGYSVFAHGEIGGLRKIYRSDDYGANWTPLANLPSNIAILSLAGDRQNAGKVFVGTGGRGVFVGQ